jgi:hypothetical protein
MLNIAKVQLRISDEYTRLAAFGSTVPLCKFSPQRTVRWSWCLSCAVVRILDPAIVIPDNPCLALVNVTVMSRAAYRYCQSGAKS